MYNVLTSSLCVSFGIDSMYDVLASSLFVSFGIDSMYDVLASSLCVSFGIDPNLFTIIYSVTSCINLQCHYLFSVFYMSFFHSIASVCLIHQTLLCLSKICTLCSLVQYNQHMSHIIFFFYLIYSKCAKIIKL